MKPGDKAIIYQIRNPSRKAEQCFIGTFTVASEVHYRYSDKEIFIKIEDFTLWKHPVPINEVIDELETVPRPGDPAYARGAIIGPISKYDYETILMKYGEKIESSY